MIASVLAMRAEAETYAERLGFPEGARVAIFHSDDLGMFIDSNRGGDGNPITSGLNGAHTITSTQFIRGWREAPGKPTGFPRTAARTAPVW